MMNKIDYLEYFGCDCGSPSHLFRLWYFEPEDKNDPDENVIYLELPLEQYRYGFFPSFSNIYYYLDDFLDFENYFCPFKKDFYTTFIDNIKRFYDGSIYNRILISIKYIFNFKIEQSIYHGTAIREEDLDRLYSCLNALDNTKIQIIKNNSHIIEGKNFNIKFYIFNIYELTEEDKLKYTEQEFKRLSALELEMSICFKRKTFIKRLYYGLKYLFNHYDNEHCDIKPEDAKILKEMIYKTKLSLT